MPNWEMMLVRAEGKSGLGTYEHFQPNEWSTGDIKKDTSLKEKDHYPAIHRFIMGLLAEGWEPLSINETDPTFAVRRTYYLFRRPWENTEDEEEDTEVEAEEAEGEPEELEEGEEE